MKSKTLFAQKTLKTEELGSFSLEYYVLEKANNQALDSTAEDSAEIYGIEIVQTAQTETDLVCETLWGITDSRYIIMSLVGKLSEFEVMPVHLSSVIDDLSSACM